MQAFSLGTNWTLFARQTHTNELIVFDCLLREGNPLLGATSLGMDVGGVWGSERGLTCNRNFGGKILGNSAAFCSGWQGARYGTYAIPFV